MTLNDIIVSALAQLDRGHDAQTIDTWRDKLTRFANEAVEDIAMTLQLRRSDALHVEDNVADIAALPRCCTKIISMYKDGTRVPFIEGPSTTLVRVLAPQGPVLVHYRYLPDDMHLSTDVPEVPAHCHGMIVTYVVARERASNDIATQRGAKLYFELYAAAKRRLKSMAGEESAYQIVNRW